MKMAQSTPDATLPRQVAARLKCTWHGLHGAPTFPMRKGGALGLRPVGISGELGGEYILLVVILPLGVLGVLGADAPETLLPGTAHSSFPRPANLSERRAWARRIFISGSKSHHADLVIFSNSTAEVRASAFGNTPPTNGRASIAAWEQSIEVVRPLGPQESQIADHPRAQRFGLRAFSA